MKTKGILAIGAGLAGLAALPGYSQTSKPSALESACRASEVTMPDSCPCTITKASQAGLTQAELASLFKDDGHSNPVSQAKYSVFWQVKSQCIADTMMASLGVSSGNPLPGIPEHMRPKMPGQAAAPGAAVAVPPAPAPRVGSIATATNKRSDAPVPADMLKRDFSGKRTVADIQAMIAQLADTAWEYTEEDGRFHRYDFLPEGNIMVYQERGGGPNSFAFTQVTQLSADQTRYGALLRTRDVTTGQLGDMPINSLTDDTLVYQKRYVRTGEEWLFKKVGQASATLPDNAPKALEDGFWRVRFNPVSKNPMIVGQNGLRGTAGPANRTLSQTAIAGAFGSGFLIGDTSSEDCRSNCFFIVNDFDQRNRRVRGRLIDESGVDYVGVRPEPMRGGANAVSVRAFDGYGGWKQWRCTKVQQTLGCSPTGSKEPPQARPALASNGSANLLAQLGAVTGEYWGEAGCSGDLYFFPANGQMPQGLDALWRHVRTQKSSHFATQVDVAGANGIGYKIKLGGRDVVLAPVREDAAGAQYTDGSRTLTLTNVGSSINDPNEPSYGFQRVRAQFTSDGQSETFDAISLGAC